jgi:hypothetical protein
MMPMDGNTIRSDVRDRVIRRLERADALDDIVMEVCQATNLSWEDAEGFVRQIQSSEQGKIAEAQFPLIAGIALFIFLAGWGLAGFGIYSLAAGAAGLLGPDDVTTYLEPTIEHGVDPLRSLTPAIGPYLTFLLNLVFSPFAAILAGGTMIAGSLAGMKNTWAVILDRWFRKKPDGSGDDQSDGA